MDALAERPAQRLHLRAGGRHREACASIINKTVPNEQMFDTAREVYSRGWRTIKLYFMIGHPSETLEDVQAIVDLAQGGAGRRAQGRTARGARSTWA